MGRPNSAAHDQPHEVRSGGAGRPWAGVLGPVDYSGQTRYRRTPRLYQRLQPLGCALTRLGIAPRYMVVLEVPGRRTGLIHRSLLVRVDLDGERYLVSLAGESEWVRNVRSDGGRAIIGRRERRAAVLEELPTKHRAAVIRAYLRRARTRGRSWGLKREARHYFGIDPDAPDDRLFAIADRYPTFRIRYEPVRERHTSLPNDPVPDTHDSPGRPG